MTRRKKTFRADRLQHFFRRTLAEGMTDREMVILLFFNPDVLDLDELGLENFLERRRHRAP